MNIPQRKSKIKYRKVLVYLLLLLVCILIGFMLIQGPPTVGERPDDFVAYWSAGRLIAMGDNPYSIKNIVVTGFELGFEEPPLIPSYYPPQILPFFLPFSLLQYPISRFLWLLLSIILLIISAFVIWQIYQGPTEKRWIIFLCILTYAPAYFALMEGQITFLTLLGISGFIFYVERRRLFLAGLVLLLMSFKIQLTYLLWFAIILWILYEKQWRVLIGLVAASLVTLAISMLLYPAVINDYYLFMIDNAPKFCNHPTLYALLCIIGGEKINWLRFIAPQAGIIWLVIFWWKYRDNWTWSEKISIIIIVSVLTAPFAWMHDEVLFLIPVIEIAAAIVNKGFSRRSYFIIAIYLGMNIFAFILIPKYQFNQIQFLWMPILFLVMYLYAKKNYSFLEENRQYE